MNQNQPTTLQELISQDTIQTRSGLQLDVFNPDPACIAIEDIAHGLSHVCRFGGHTSTFLSVAEHCFHIANELPPELKLEGLMHDATEGYLGDMPKPIKKRLPDYEALEKNLMLVIAKKFNLCYPFPKIIKEKDILLLQTEHSIYMNPRTKVSAMTPDQAYNAFMHQFFKYSR